MSLTLFLLLIGSTSFKVIQGFSLVPESLSSFQQGQVMLLLQHQPIWEPIRSAAAILHHPMDDSPWQASSRFGVSLLDRYRNVLHLHPLPTQLVTGGVLAVLGDAVAQTNNNSQKDGTTTKRTNSSYDHRRAISFMTFDMAYRVVQHCVFPWITTHCHGQYLEAILHTMGISSSLLSFDASFGAAIEGTMVNQLVIVPFFYYPVFFAVTALVQGLTFSEGCQRAQSMWVPLLQRNLAFWIPVQFVQFRYVEESLQIPFVCVAGLCWTIILSTVVGNSKLPQGGPIISVDVSGPDPLLDTTTLQEVAIVERMNRNSTATALLL
jgi:hypothetical protein